MTRRQRINQDASLKEVLREVSILDAVKLARSLLIAWIACGAMVAIASAIEAVGVRPLTAGWHVPNWIFYLGLTWLAVFIYASEASFHRHVTEWYFPRLGCLTSLPVAAALYGFIFLSLQIKSTATSSNRLLLVGFWLLAGSAIYWIVGLLQIGHSKLIAKRQAELDHLP